MGINSKRVMTLPFPLLLQGEHMSKNQAGLSTYEQCQLRGWAIDYSLRTNKGAESDKIIADAQKYAGFMFGTLGKVEVLELNKKEND